MRDGTARLAAQLYTLRDAGLRFDGMLRVVADAGYDGVETVGTHGLSGAELREALAAHGLHACSAHVKLAALEDSFDATLATYREAGIDTLVVPFLAPDDRPADAEGWTALASRLRDLAERCRAEGVDLLYHNHDFEFARAGGDTALAHLLRETEPLGLELDLGWAVRAGADAADLLARYDGRVRRVHVKDLRPGGGPDEGGWADVGHGTIPWGPLLDRLREIPVPWWIVEHDAPADPVRTIRRSARFLREAASGRG